MKRSIKAAILALILSHNGLANDVGPISLDQATKQVIEKGYRVLAAHTEEIDNKTIYLIKVLTPEGLIRYIQIDAETGELLN
ncbi:hypothetical protein JCM14076_30880 [Methylosoma difficile]